MFPFLKHKKSVEEMEEESERVDAEVSLKQKQVILAELKKRDLELKHFGKPSDPWTLQKAWSWLKTH